MAFRIQGLDPAPFSHLYGRSDNDLASFGAHRFVVDAKPGFPDRIELRDLDPGETAILLNYEHLAVDTPYRSRHAIFVREGAQTARDLVDEVPEAIRTRTISLRAFDAAGNMRHADLAEGDALVPLIQRFFADPEVAYLHAHYAKRGCYAAQIVRA